MTTRQFPPITSCNSQIINSTFGQVAIYGVETDATNYPVRYSARCLIAMAASWIRPTARSLSMGL